jgi:hypothetical protein
LADRGVNEADQQATGEQQMTMMFTGMIILPDEFPALLGAAIAGDNDAGAIVNVIANWFKQVTAITDPNKMPLCLDCDTAFSSTAPPLAFAVLMSNGALGQPTVTA